MVNVESAKKTFIKINEMLDFAFDAPKEAKQEAILGLKKINEELSEKIIDKLKKLELYERGQIGNTSETERGDQHGQPDEQ
jgi:hypothetical protein